MAARRPRHHPHSDEIEALAASVADTGDVYLVPAFAGLGAPQWDAAARGTIVGLTRGIDARAYRARRAREHRIPDRRPDRGDAAGRRASAVANCASMAAPRATICCMQFQADLLGVPVLRPRTPKRRRLARRRWPDSASASGSRRTNSRRCGSSRSASSRACRARKRRDAVLAGARRWNDHAPGRSEREERKPRRLVAALVVTARARWRAHWWLQHDPPHLSHRRHRRISWPLFAAPPAADSPATRA